MNQGASKAPAGSGLSVRPGGASRSELESLAVAYRDTGDRFAFDAYARSFLPLARRFAAARFPFEVDARDDAVQEALVRLVTALRSYRGGAPVSFAYGVLYRVCADVRRKLARERARTNRILAMGRVENERSELRQDPASGAIAADRSSALLAALDALDERSRIALYLKDAEDLSVADVAATLGLKEGTVKSILSRARAQARRSLEEAGYGRQD